MKELSIELEWTPDPRIAELTEMLTAATDTAVRRGKLLDRIQAWRDELDNPVDVLWFLLDDILADHDGG
jgi:hypothetical protein